MNTTLFVKNTGVGQILDETFSRCPDREAIVYDDWRITYAELQSLVFKTAHYLQKIGVRQGDRVAIVSRNCPEFIICDLAVLKLGATSVKFNWRLSPDEMKYLIDLNEVSCVFMRPEKPEWGEELVQHYAGKIPFIEIGFCRASFYELLKDETDEPVEVEVAPEFPAYHMHTSGTTGLPKCVEYSTERFLLQMEGMLSQMEFTDGMVYQFISQLFHSASIAAYLLLVRGGKLVLMHQFEVESYCESLVREKVNAIGVIPVVLQGILDEAEKKHLDLSNLHVINYSTCPIQPMLLDRAMKMLDCRFYQVYGMTEMTGGLTLLAAEDHFIDEGAHLRSVGRPFPGASVKIVDDDGNEVPNGETGEILVRGNGMMMGYYKQQDKTDACIKDGWYYTKDLGRLDDKGYLYIRGRKDAMIISGGENIYPEEVQNVVLKHDAVKECAVYGIPDEKWGERVKASVVLFPGCEVTAEELNAFCRKHSPSYRLPREYEFLPELPKNATGKVLINELKKRSVK